MNSIWDWIKSEWAWIRFDTNEISKLKDRVEALEDWKAQIESKLKTAASHLEKDTAALQSAENSAGQIIR